MKIGTAIIFSENTISDYTLYWYLGLEIPDRSIYVVFDQKNYYCIYNNTSCCSIPAAPLLPLSIVLLKLYDLKSYGITLC